VNLIKLSNMPEPFGYEVKGIDLATCGKEEMWQLAELCKKHLVICIKSQPVSVERYAQICYAWGRPHSYTDIDQITDPEVLDDLRRMSFPHLPGMGRITGIRDAEGNRTGMFADGELDWHCNQSGTTNPKPVVALQAVEGTAGTHTQFLEGVTGYAELTPADRAVVDGLVAIYGWKFDAIGPGAHWAQQEIVHRNNNPVEGFRKSIVSVSPGGHRGINYSFNTIIGFEGKTAAENMEIDAWLKDLIFKDSRVYTHAWDDGDVLFMDQIVTLHKRPTKDCTKRLLHRIAFDFSRVPT
jgi:alpha-ketoglutarate-dependent taurine dioxygenase